jgi:flagellar basal body-associated protein FliL
MQSAKTKKYIKIILVLLVLMVLLFVGLSFMNIFFGDGSDSMSKQEKEKYGEEIQPYTQEELREAIQKPSEKMQENEENEEEGGIEERIDSEEENLSEEEQAIQDALNKPLPEDEKNTYSPEELQQALQ